MSLIVQDLTKRYGDKVVVDHLSFRIDQPGVYALLGSNGAGKTTSIRMMLGILARDGGTVLWNDRPLNTDTCNVGYLAEERGLYPKYDLMDQLVYFASLRGVGRAEARKRIKYWAERLEVGEYLYPQMPKPAPEQALLGGRKRRPVMARQKIQKPKKADQLSKGNQQKIQFMTALLSDPELLILDEPLSGLDPVNADLFKSILREEIARCKYLIMSSHQMSVVEEFCTDLTILHRSRTVLQGHLKVEQDVRPYIEAAGARIVTEKEFDYQIKVSGEEQANRLLAALIADRIPVVTFDLREPSLHEIFVETVGGDSDE